MRYFFRMTAIANRLDRKLKSLSPARAASVVRLVEDVLAVVDAAPTTEADRAEAIEEHRKHIAKCLDMASKLDWSDFERPDQGVEEVREEW